MEVCVEPFKVLKPRKLRKSGTANESEIEAATTEAAVFIRDGLLRLGPTFVKLGQVISTRTDVLSPAYIKMLKTLQDDVPAFGGKKAKRIVEEELGRTSARCLRSSARIHSRRRVLGRFTRRITRGRKWL